MRKRKLNNIFQPMTEFISLYKSYEGAAHRKYYRISVMSFSANLEENVFELQKLLREGTYSFGPYRNFYVFEPKTRLIETAPFRDRVVHHAIFNAVFPVFLSQFYKHSYACIPERGTQAALLTLAKWINKSKRKYFLKCDVKRYFPSVSRDILKEILRKTIVDEKMLVLLDRLIDTAPNNGIPIGNLTSQLFANAYLNELDEYVKRVLRVKHYIRYMDDFILILDSEEQARKLKRYIQEFLFKKLKLELSPQKVHIGVVKEGVPFVGYFVKPHSIRVRGASLRRSQLKVKKAYRSSFQVEDFDLESNWDEEYVKQSKFFRSWSSYYGRTLVADNSYGLHFRMIEELKEYRNILKRRRGSN